MIPPVVYSYLGIAPLFLILGLFITVKSIKAKVFNLTWTGFVILSYSFYFVGIFLNAFGLLGGIWNLILEVIYFGIDFEVLIFTKETFYKYKSKRFLIIVAFIILGLGIACSTLAMLGDTSLPFASISDKFDAWRYFIADIITTPIVYTPLLLATWREFNKTRREEPALSRRFLIYFTSLLTSVVSSACKEIGTIFQELYSIFVVLVVFTAVYSVIALYIVWLSPGKSKQGNVVVNTSEALDIGIKHGGETIITSAAIYRVIENLGATLSAFTGQSPHACNGLLLILIERELGTDSLYHLDLAKLLNFFDGPLLHQLTILGVSNSDAAISALKNRLAEQYAAFSLGLFSS